MRTILCLLFLSLFIFACNSRNRGPTGPGPAVIPPTSDSGLPRTGGGPACSNSCIAVQGAMCGGDADCLSECEDIVAQANAVGCGAQFDAFLACSTTATFFCEDGRARTNDCQTQLMAVAACAPATP